MTKRIYKSEVEEILALRNGLEEILEMLQTYRYSTAEVHCKKVLGILGRNPTKKERKAFEDLKNSWAERGGANSTLRNWNPGESTLFR
jgi:hypothetical protein